MNWVKNKEYYYECYCGELHNNKEDLNEHLKKCYINNNIENEDCFFTCKNKNKFKGFNLFHCCKEHGYEFENIYENNIYFLNKQEFLICKWCDQIYSDNKESNHYYGNDTNEHLQHCSHYPKNRMCGSCKKYGNDCDGYYGDAYSPIDDCEKYELKRQLKITALKEIF